MATKQIAQCIRQTFNIFNSSVLINSTPFSCRTIRSIRLNNSSLQIRNYSAQRPRLYTDKHEWVEVDENVGTVGITHYAQEALGDVVFAQLPELGMEVCQHDEVGTLESVKAASEIFSPISGKVVEINMEVEESPGLINKDCYTKGWLFKIAMSKADTELKELMDEKAYNSFLKKAQQ